MKPKTLMFIAVIMAATVFAAGCIQQTGDKVLEDGTILKPDGTMIKPDGTMVKPDGVMIKPDGTMVKPDGTMIKPDGTMILPNGTMVEPENQTGSMEKPSNNTGTAEFSGTILAGNSAKVIDFNKADYDKATGSDDLVVLYFYADWCPICRAEVPEMYNAFNELTTGDVVAFRVNFNDGSTDSDERALAQQFGVPYQHTKVFTLNGKQILKSPETWSKERYISEINAALV